MKDILHNCKNQRGKAQCSLGVLRMTLSLGHWQEACVCSEIMQEAPSTSTITTSLCGLYLSFLCDRVFCFLTGPELSL